MSERYNNSKTVSHVTFDKSKEILFFNFMGKVFRFDLKLLNFDNSNVSKRITKNTYYFFCIHRLLKRLGLI